MHADGGSTTPNAKLLSTETPIVLDRRQQVIQLKKSLETIDLDAKYHRKQDKSLRVFRLKINQTCAFQIENVLLKFLNKWPIYLIIN